MQCICMLSECQSLSYLTLKLTTVSWAKLLEIDGSVFDFVDILESENVVPCGLVGC